MSYLNWVVRYVPNTNSTINLVFLILNFTQLNLLKSMRTVILIMNAFAKFLSGFTSLFRLPQALIEAARVRRLSFEHEGKRDEADRMFVLEMCAKRRAYIKNARTKLEKLKVHTHNFIEWLLADLPRNTVRTGFNSFCFPCSLLSATQFHTPSRAPILKASLKPQITLSALPTPSTTPSSPSPPSATATCTRPAGSKP